MDDDLLLLLTAHRRLLAASPELMVPTPLANEQQPELLRFSDFQLALFLLTAFQTLVLEAVFTAGRRKEKLPPATINDEDEDENDEPSLPLLNNDDDVDSDEYGEEEQTGGGVFGGGPESVLRSVNRFGELGGGWGYSAHSVDAIQFRVIIN
jgi:hypothetical protein